uniref:Lipase n=1 Tax=Dendroctonus ponderosae TaxID=77166 RepID=A0AAR5Q7J7_DENPD
MIITSIIIYKLCARRMRSVCIFIASFVLFTSIAILLEKEPVQKGDMGLSMHQFCQKYGYPIEEETVTTEDGYILTMHRIKCSLNRTGCHEKRPAVLLLHGLLASSADFVSARNQSLAFQLVDKGYDVWLGNNRGNTYSRNHIMLDPNEDKSFWNFSFHETGMYDLPAMIDHIIQKSQVSKVTFIGISQGCTSYMVLSSLKPEYNEKILLANLVAPVTTFYPTKSIVLKILTFFNFIVKRFLYFYGHFELFGEQQIETKLFRYLCIGPHKVANYICLEQILTYAGGFSDQRNYDLFPFHLSVSPAGASTKQVMHIIQNRISGQFAQYDHSDQNPQKLTAPIYNVSRITTPVAVYFGKSDIFVSVEGLHEQLKSIPNVVLRYKVPYERFNHMDFIYAKDLNRLVNNKIMETIDIYNN